MTSTIQPAHAVPASAAPAGMDCWRERTFAERAALVELAHGYLEATELWRQAKHDFLPKDICDGHYLAFVNARCAFVERIFDMLGVDPNRLYIEPVEDWFDAVKLEGKEAPYPAALVEATVMQENAPIQQAILLESVALQMAQRQRSNGRRHL